MIQRCKIILIMLFVVIFITGCSCDDADNWVSEIRREALLREILIESRETKIEAQETNAILKRIEDRLDRAEYGN